MKRPLLGASLLALTAAMRTAHPMAQDRPEPGSFRLSSEGGLRESRSGAARFEADVDEETEAPRFVLGFLTGGGESGLYLLRAGSEPLAVGDYRMAEVEVDANGGFEPPSLDRERLSAFFFELGRGETLVLGSTGEGRVTIETSDQDSIRGRFRITMKGYQGNPRALFGIRPREGVVIGSFEATPGELQLRLP